MTTDPQEVKELFDSITVPIPGSTGLHATTFEAFQKAAEKLTKVAYYNGYKKSSDFAIGEIMKISNKQS